MRSRSCRVCKGWHDVEAPWPEACAGLSGDSGSLGHRAPLAGAIHGLPSAATAGAGARAFVTDALAPVFGSTVAGGGACRYCGEVERIDHLHSGPLAVMRWHQRH